MRFLYLYLEGIKVVKNYNFEEGSKLLRHSTSCTGTDHDAGEPDSD